MRPYAPASGRKCDHRTGWPLGCVLMGPVKMEIPGRSGLRVRKSSLSCRGCQVAGAPVIPKGWRLPMIKPPLPVPRRVSFGAQKSTCNKGPSAHQIIEVLGFHESGIHCRVYIGRPGDRFASILCIASTPPRSRRRTASDQFSAPNSRRISAHLRYCSLVCESTTQLTPGKS